MNTIYKVLHLSDVTENYTFEWAITSLVGRSTFGCVYTPNWVLVPLFLFLFLFLMRSILSFLGSHLVTSLPIFGLFRCLWSVLHSYFSQTAPESIWNLTENDFFRGSQSTCLVRSKVRISAFTLLRL